MSGVKKAFIGPRPNSDLGNKIIKLGISSTLIPQTKLDFITLCLLVSSSQ